MPNHWFQMVVCWYQMIDLGSDIVVFCLPAIDYWYRFLKNMLII